MDVLIIKMLEIELFAGCSQVAILVPVALCNSVDCCDQHKATDVKLSLVEQERFF